MEGASGVRDGVPVCVALAPLTPARFTARIRTVYAVPLVSPLITQGDAVEDGDRDIQVEPLNEYS